jgi:hypothetical protein
MHRRIHLRASTLLLLGGLQWGCHAAAPTVDPLTALTQQVQQERAADRARSQRTLCGAYGFLAELITYNRDQQGVTLAEALAKLTVLERQNPDDPNMPAVVAFQRQLIQVIYTHPTWTTQDAWQYAEQKCLRDTPR